MPRKKKTETENPEENKVQNVIEPPKNLLPDEKKEEITPASETPAVVTPPSVTPAESPPVVAPPPISPPFTKADTSMPNQLSSKKLIWLGLIIALLIAGGVWVFFSNKSGNKTNTQINNSATQAVVQPTTVATEEAKPDKYPIKVLNGSGLVGEASKLKELLEKEDFVVSSTGNADNYDYTATVIQAKKSVEKSFVEKLKKLIAKTYSVGKDELLDASDSSDVTVIIGSKKASD